MKVQGQIWRDDFSDIGYAVGKINIIYLILDRKRRKEFEKIWIKQIEPVKDEDYKIRFIEDGRKYTFISYGKSNSNLIFYKRKMDMNTPYSKFKEKINNDTMFTFGYKKGNNLRLSEKCKTINDIKILPKSDIPPDSVERRLIANDEA